MFVAVLLTDVDGSEFPQIGNEKMERKKEVIKKSQYTSDYNRKQCEFLSDYMFTSFCEI